jgi:hypothetical protein
MQDFEACLKNQTTIAEGEAKSNLESIELHALLFM